jgi:hypothetical protein
MPSSDRRKRAAAIAAAEPLVPRRGGRCHLVAMGRLRAAILAATDTSGEQEVRHALAAVLECWALHTAQFRDQARRMTVILLKLVTPLLAPPPGKRAAVQAFAALGETLDLAFDDDLLGEEWDIVRVLLDPDFDDRFHLDTEDAAKSQLLWRPAGKKARRARAKSKARSGRKKK